MSKINVMHNQYCLILERVNGTIVHLICTYAANPFSLGSLRSQFDTYAVVETPGAEHRKVFTHETPPNKSLNGMSVKEYIDHGRVGLMSVVRPNELFKVSDLLEAKLRANV